MHVRILQFTLVVLGFVYFTSATAVAQNTTAAMNGVVTDRAGEPLPGATVIAVHGPSGTQYGISTLFDGSYTLRGMRVGGPYQISISFIGYQKLELSGIFLKLGESKKLNVTLAEDAVNMDEVEVTANASADINSERTGAATSVSSEQLKALPTISRSTSDFTRLTPQSNGNSFGGRNNLYNNFSLDGSVFNNSFGLDVATPGGQAGAQPVSLDAIEQVQVSLAPFDVREGGFTGAGVNAVTKSGTNEFKGTVYTFGRNENMIGNKVAGQQIDNLDYFTHQTGFSLGGPIVKNKLFFFVNAEAERANERAHGFVANRGEEVGGNVTSVSYDDIMAVKNHLMNEWGYDAGEFENYNHQKSNDKLLVKLDWNINKDHNFSIRYNHLSAWKDILPHPEAIIGRGPTPYRLPFSNSSYKTNSVINSWMGELNSRFGNKASNKLQIGYSNFHDFRTPWSEPFPVIDIFDTNGQLAITAGSEIFSTNNVVTQDVFQFRDDFTYYTAKHTFTAGTNIEIFKFDNSFNLFYYPWHMFFSLEDFLNTTKADMDFNAQVTEAQKNDYFWSELDVAQAAFYVQDEFQVTDNFKLTMGVRMDIPIYLSEVAYDSTTAEFDGWVDADGKPANVDPSTFPKARPLWSPRVGFNWDITGDQRKQLRGGSGIFTGRIPFVWLGNQATNYKIDPGYTFQVNDTEDDFKFPQVWKTNLAYDHSFGKGWFASLEGIFSRDLNAVVHRNYNILAPSENAEGTGDNRPIFGGFDETNIYSGSEGSIGFLDAGAIVLENVDKGYQYSLTAQVKKQFLFGLNIMGAYTFQESKDFTSIPAEIAADAFQRNPQVMGPNNSQFAHSRYGLRHRFITSVDYRKEYAGGKLATSIALFGEVAKGNRYSYTYVGDMNRDGIATNNDLIYVPADQNDIVFADPTTADAQWTALDAFIEQDPYLSTRRGEYADRNGAMLPWYTQFDIRMLQDYNFTVAGRKNTLQLSLDILNFGNMLNSNWGVRQLPTTTSPINFEGYQDGTNVPMFSFDTNLKESFTNDVSIMSKWQMQVGARWIF
ncbi:TonB-dependent receptor plug domain-containing protein [Algivirga pacifica]|uniref:Carboxypeptidase regulatory-like domain-containing protein n=1 Tax=Algivirga pacifica TaxID=1162670 RepID=A0ABP9DEP0_9BACT